MQLGRPMLEMLIVLSLGIVLMVSGIASFRKVIYNYKANAMLDYINQVYSSARGKSLGNNFLGLSSEDPSIGIPGERIVANPPSVLSSCTVNRICGCGSNTETGCHDCDDPRNVTCQILKNSKDLCVVTVTAYFNDGEEGAAKTLEARLDLEVRNGIKNLKENRPFMKANCLPDNPKECSYGFAKCTKENRPCSNISRRKIN